MGRASSEPEGSAVQGLVEVSNEVLGILNADREAQQAVVEARAREQLLRHLGMRLGDRVRQQAFDAAEALGEGNELEAAEHFEIMLPKPVAWLLWSAWPGWSGSPT